MTHLTEWNYQIIKRGLIVHTITLKSYLGFIASPDPAMFRISFTYNIFCMSNQMCQDNDSGFDYEVGHNWCNLAVMNLKRPKLIFYWRILTVLVNISLSKNPGFKIISVSIRKIVCKTSFMRHKICKVILSRFESEVTGYKVFVKK